MIKIRKERKSNKVSAGSMADIAFLLLIFFLVATTIDNEEGIVTKLAPYRPDLPTVSVPTKSVFIDLYLNAEGKFMLNGKEVELSLLREKLKSSIEENTSFDKSTIINLTHDRATRYKDYLDCFNEIEGCYNELWDEVAHANFSNDFKSISRTQKLSIMKRYEKKVAEKEPTKHGKES